MNKADEDKARAYGEMRAEKFRKAYNVSPRQWALAEAMTDDLSAKLLAEFWEA